MGKDLRGKELGVGIGQRKDGRYQARFTKKNGERIEKNFSKLIEAQNWIYDQRRSDTMLSTGDMTVNDWYEQWLKIYKKGIVRDNTIKGYEQRYKFNIKKEIGSMNLCDVRQTYCQTLLNKMQSSGKYSVGTIKLTRITLHAIFQAALDNNYITTNPAINLKVNEDVSDEEKERRVLTKNEESVFKEYSKNTMYNNAFCLVLETGLRVGEIGGLKWSDIDFENKVLKVRRTMLQDPKKGGFYLGNTKSKASNRIVPLTNEAISILNNQREKQNKLKVKSKNWHNEWDDLVFTTINGNPVGSSTFRTMMIRIVNNINCDRKLNSKNEEFVEFEYCYMHSLRHTFATRCIENGVQPKTLQKVLGHSTITTTMDLYVHATDEHVFEEMKKMNH